MAVDWQRTRATVERMIATYGRPITMIDDATAADPSDPLGAPGAPIEVPDIMAVFVRPSGYIQLGESDYMELGMWPEAEKIALVLPSLVHRFQDFTRVIDTNGQGFKIFKTELLQPGPVPVLIYVGMKQ